MPIFRHSWIGKVLSALKQYDAVADVRSIGLAAAIEFHNGEDCSKVYHGLSEKGFFVGHVANCITCKPPYVITKEQIQEFVRAALDCVTKL